MIKNILGDKATSIIGLILGILGLIAANQSGIIPGSITNILGSIVSIGTMIFGGVTTTKSAN